MANYHTSRTCCYAGFHLNFLCTRRPSGEFLQCWIRHFLLFSEFDSFRFPFFFIFSLRFHLILVLLSSITQAPDSGIEHNLLWITSLMFSHWRHLVHIIIIENIVSIKKYLTLAIWKRSLISRTRFQRPISSSGDQDHSRFLLRSSCRSRFLYFPLEDWWGIAFLSYRLLSFNTFTDLLRPRVTYVTYEREQIVPFDSLRHSYLQSKFPIFCERFPSKKTAFHSKL